MTFDPNTIPVAENTANMIKYKPGEVLDVPPGTTCQLKKARVLEIKYGRPGGIMLVKLEPVE
jgi:hypothetical protein